MSPSRFPILIFFVLGSASGGASTMGRQAIAPAQADVAKPPVQERLNRIREDLFAGGSRVHDDISELKDILAATPRSAEGHLLLGIAYRTVGSQELMGEAVAELRQALDLDPRFVAARFFLARLYMDLGRPARARDEMEAAVAEVPGNPQFVALLGEAERQLKNPRRSVELTRRALAMNDSDAEARYYLALALFDLGQRDEATMELERVVQSGPNVVDPYLSLGVAYIDAGRFDDALRALGEGTRVDAARPDVHIQLARAYRSKGLLTKAEEQLKLASPTGGGTLAPSYYQRQQAEFDLLVEHGALKLQRGQLAAAVVAFEKVLEMDPEHGPTNRYMAEVCLKQGLYVKAAGHAARAEKAGTPLPAARLKLLQDALAKKRPGAER